MHVLLLAATLRPLRYLRALVQVADGHLRDVRIAALCALTVLVIIPGAAAQLRYGKDQADKISEQLLRVHSKQQAGDYHAARDILLQALSEVPDSAPLLDALGSVEQDLGEYFEAERSYLRALNASAAAAGDPAWSPFPRSAHSAKSYSHCS